MSKFDAEFEEQILAQALRDKKFMGRASPVLRSHSFATKYHGWVWEQVKSDFDKHGEVPTPAMLTTRARKMFPGEAAPYQALVCKVSKAPEKPMLALGELREFNRFDRLQVAMEEAVKHAERNNLDDAYSAIRKIVAEDMPTESPLVKASDVRPERARFLWRPYIPLGKLCSIEGNPGEGKSSVTMDIVARASTGKAFEGSERTREPMDAIVVNIEDGVADTIVPRLLAAGADLSRVHIFGRDSLSLPDELPLLEHLIKETKAGVVVIDPLMAHIDKKVDSHKDQHVRLVTTPLGRIAQETGSAVILVRHLNKTKGGPAIYRGSGSIGLSGAVRTALIVGRSPDDKSERVLAMAKSNLAAFPPSLRFCFDETSTGTARIKWLGECSHDADGLVAEPEEPGTRSAVDSAADFLREALADGPRKYRDLEQDAKDAGISISAIKRAKTRLGIKAMRVADAWVWPLPEHRETVPPKEHPSEPLRLAEGRA